MTKDVIRITGSALRFTQAVDAIKRFVIPKIDYELMANTAPTNCLSRLDELIRGRLSKMIGAAGIPTAWFYTTKTMAVFTYRNSQIARKLSLSDSTLL